MSVNDLPALDATRMQLGVLPTSCSCPECTAFCGKRPGMFIPDDLPRLFAAWHAEPVHMIGEFGGVIPPALADLLPPGPKTQRQLLTLALSRLMASPGAVARAPDGTVIRIPTIIPRFEPGVGCASFQDGRCEIYDHAPFGCRFFDAHQPVDKAHELSKRAHITILESHRDGTLYAQLWQFLGFEAGIAPPADVGWQATEKSVHVSP